MAYGNVKSDGTIRNGSGNFTVTHQATGTYIIALDPPMASIYEYDIVEVTPIGFTNDNYAIWSTDAGGDIFISAFDQSGAKEDCSFSFMAYKL